MTMLLGVPRSQWSMFKSGKLALPLKPMQQLTALLLSVQQEKGMSTAVTQLLEEEEQRTNTQCKKEEIKTEVKLRRIQKEIAIAECNRIEALAAFQTMAHLSKQEVPDDGLILIIRDHALKTFNKYNQYSLEQLHLNQESLLLMKTAIQQKIQKVGGEVQFTDEPA
ncbi:hypothetical protein [Flavobacterium sp. GCM10027622]|uniref:hypothetical protein n=1 Tax=unclassified Flavobacterium TaxID=196869 RepID=UPI003613664C